MNKYANTVNGRIYNYPVITHFIEDASESGGYYLAYNPDFGFSACSAAGDSPEEAIELLADVRGFLIDLYLEKGKPLPEPSPDPTKFDELHQMPIRITKELHSRLKETAKNSGMSLNSLMTRIVTEYLTTKSFEDRLNSVVERLEKAEKKSSESWLWLYQRPENQQMQRAQRITAQCKTVPFAFEKSMTEATLCSVLATTNPRNTNKEWISQ